MNSITTCTKPGFLDLPAELRNNIYQLALTHNSPLFAERNWPRGRVLLSASASSDIDPTQEFNQLKYVCRQLNKEAAGLELKYNDIEIWKLDKDGHNVGEMLTLVVGRVGKSKRHWLTGIVFHLKDKSAVIPQRDDCIDTRTTIVAFCTVHPLTTVHYTAPEWSIKRLRKDYGTSDNDSGPLLFFVDGLGLSIVLHGLLPIPALTPMIFLNRLKNVGSDELIAPGKHRVSNFRIFPSDIGIEEDESAILEVGLWLGRFGCLPGSRPNDLDAFANQCLEMFRGWVKHGV